jgi:hypothetical protein
MRKCKLSSVHQQPSCGEHSTPVTEKLCSKFSYVLQLTNAAFCFQVLDLIPLADSVVRLAARCAYCAQPALFTLRIAADDRQELVGGADKYAPVCRHHYISLDNVRGQLPDAAAQ